MQIKKRAKFSILLATIFLFSLPIVFAQIFPSFFYSGFYPESIESLYLRYQSWVDFIVFFLIISSIVRFGFMKIYGGRGEEGKEPTGAAGIYLGLGLAGSLGITLLFRNMGLSMINFAPYLILIALFLSLAAIYMVLSGKDKLSIGVAILFIFLAFILLTLLFPGLFYYMNSIPWLWGIISLVLTVGIPIAILATLLWLASKIRFAGGGNGEKGGGKESERQERERGGTRESLRVKILIIPEMKKYPVGTTLTLVADVLKRRLSIGKRRAGNYMCNWYIGNIQLADQHDQRIEYTIPPDIITRPEQKIKISVHVVDTENPGIEGYNDRKIVVIKQEAAIPLIRITSPKDTVELEEGARLPLKLKYELNPNIFPDNVSEFGWFIADGTVNLTGNATLRSLRARLVGEGNNIEVVIGDQPLILRKGIYTLFVVALARTGTNFIEWRSPGNVCLFDRKFIKVNSVSGQQAKAKLNVYKRTGKGKTGRSLILTANQLQQNQISASINDVFYFQPVVENGNISDYNITWGYPQRPDRWAVSKENIGALVINSPGEKQIVCDLKRNNVTTTIIVTINVDYPSPYGPYSPPTQQSNQRQSGTYPPPIQPDNQEEYNPYTSTQKTFFFQIVDNENQNLEYFKTYGNKSTKNEVYIKDNQELKFKTGITNLTPQQVLNNYRIIWTIKWQVPESNEKEERKIPKNPWQPDVLEFSSPVPTPITIEFLIVIIEKATTHIKYRVKITIDFKQMKQITPNSILN